MSRKFPVSIPDVIDFFFRFVKFEVVTAVIIKNAVCGMLHRVPLWKLAFRMNVAPV
jgi:hypothetical protein